MEPKGYAQEQFGQFWPVAGPRIILVVAGYASNRGSKSSKNLPSGIGLFTNTKVYIPLSRERWVQQER